MPDSLIRALDITIFDPDMKRDFDESVAKFHGDVASGFYCLVDGPAAFDSCSDFERILGREFCGCSRIRRHAKYLRLAEGWSRCSGVGFATRRGGGSDGGAGWVGDVENRGFS